MKHCKRLLALFLIVFLVLGCGKARSEKEKVPVQTTTAATVTTTTTTTTIITSTTTTIADTEAATTQTDAQTQAAAQTKGYAPSADRSQTGQGKRIAIDAGHQARGNQEKEPIGPGAGEMKAKVASGTSGKISGLAEYQLTLMVSQKLREELLSRGYEVFMVRESHDVNISNSERAQMANNVGADAFVRIHADSSENASVKGASTLCQTAGNPYNGNLYAQSRKLSECILNEMTEETGGKKRSVMETDTMSGINWCAVPVTIVEMGFMSNPEEDALMATESYQWKIACGIADGLDAYFSN